MITQESIYWLIVLWVSLSFHEWAHAYTAWRLGDDTAQRMGRLTLNPLAHVDLIGTVLLPLMQVPFGWAKPVPVNPTRFRPDVNMRMGMVWTAAAGPISNILLATLIIIGYGLASRFEMDMSRRLETWLRISICLNFMLAFFNLLPIPPLDGGRIADGLMPRRYRPAWVRIARVAPLALIAVILIPIFTKHNLLLTPYLKMQDLMYVMLEVVAGHPV